MSDAGNQMGHIRAAMESPEEYCIAMKVHACELETEARRSIKKQDCGVSSVLVKLVEKPALGSVMLLRSNAILKASLPILTPKI